MSDGVQSIQQVKLGHTLKEKKAVREYVEAQRTLNALVQASKDEPEVDRRQALLAARVEVKNTYAKLRGGDLGHARRILAGQES